MDYTPPVYTPRRRPFRHRPRRSLLETGDPLDTIVPSSNNIAASLSRPLMAPTRRIFTPSRRRSLLASSFDPDCPFSFQPPKKRKIEDYSRPQAGNKLMKLSLAYCDGGTYEGEKYKVGNMLVDDSSVYCTERYSCNIVLQHETKQPFTLEYLEIKAPPHGFTSPVSEGVIAVTNEDFNHAVEKIAGYGRMVPLKKRVKRSAVERLEDEDTVELEYLSMRNRYSAQEELDEEEVEEYADGERLTEFDVVAGYRGEEDDDDKDEEEEEEGGEEQEAEDGGGAVGSDGEEATIEGESDGDDETITPATTAGSMPWPPLRSQRLPRAADIEDENDVESGNQHDCPYDITGEEEVEEYGEPTDGESSDYELRRWILRNRTEERRRRRRRREEEAEAEGEYVQSDGTSRGEAYMRFQLRDNKTFIVFNPPRYCKYVVLKLWGSKIDNVDVQSILGYGFYGKRVFPAIELR
ncbi:hypothetical protein TWF281_006089 [Arthrobotrys megalospora]